MILKYRRESSCCKDSGRGSISEIQEKLREFKAEGPAFKILSFPELYLLSIYCFLLLLHMVLNNIISSEDFNSLQEYLRTNNYSKVGILVDENTHTHCYPLIKGVLPSHTLYEIKSGEEHKNIHTCSSVWEWMTHERFDRKALLINLGGGVIGDMGGFCAATFKRGIRFINIPTTLLSQVDASVGGKLGIDFMGYKNHIGVFSEPERVFINPRFLETLSFAELRSGFAEVLKHGLIADNNYWKEVRTINIHTFRDWKAIIDKSVEIKHNVVQQDPTEKGLRKILNFGHTIGHAIETFYLNTSQRLLHGEAIAIGMICEAYLSQIKTGLSAEAVNRIAEVLNGIYEPVMIEGDSIDSIIDLSLQDKKNQGREIRAALLESEGKAVFDIPLSRKDIKDAINFYIKSKG